MAVITTHVSNVNGPTTRFVGAGWQNTSRVSPARAEETASAKIQILPSTLTVGREYLIIFGCGLEQSENGVLGEIRMGRIDSAGDWIAGDLSTANEDHHFKFECSNGEGSRGMGQQSAAEPIWFMEKWTAVSGSGIGIEVLPHGLGANSTSNEIRLLNPQLFMIDLSELTENTHYWFDSGTTTAGNETGIGLNHSSVFFTEAAGTERHHVFLWGNFISQASNGGVNMTMDSNRAGTVTSDEIFWGDQGEQPAGPDTMGSIGYQNFSANVAGGYTYTLTSSGANWLHKASRVFVFRESAFAHADSSVLTGGVTISGHSDWDHDISSDTLSSDVGGNGLVIQYAKWGPPSKGSRSWEMNMGQDATSTNFEWANYPTPIPDTGTGDTANTVAYRWGNRHYTSAYSSGFMLSRGVVTLNTPFERHYYCAAESFGGSDYLATDRHTTILKLETPSTVKPITLTAASTTDASTARVTQVIDITLSAASTTDASTARATAVRGITHTGASTTDASTVTIDTFTLITLSAVSTTDAGTADVDLIRPITLTGASTTDAATAVVTQLKPITFTGASTTDASSPTVDTGGEVTPTPWFGTAIGERFFQRPDKWTPSLTLQEHSGITINEQLNDLIVVSDPTPEAYSRLDASTGALIGTENSVEISWTPDGATEGDVEGVAWLGPSYVGPTGTSDDWYAILHEGTATSDPTIGIVEIPVGNTSTLGDADITDHVLTSLPAMLTGLPGGVGNAGHEALTYDRVNDLFYVGAQSLRTADAAGQYGLWKVDPNDSWSQTFLFAWGDTINEGGTGLSGIGVVDSAVVADIQSGTLFAGDCIFVATRGTTRVTEFPNRRIYQLDLTSGNEGNILSWFDYAHWSQDADGNAIGVTSGTGRDPQVEGFCMSDDGLTIYQCREEGGQGATIFRSQAATMSHDTYNPLEVNDDGWYYYDEDSGGASSLFDRSPNWADPAFDIDASEMFGPNQAAFAHDTIGGVEGTGPLGVWTAANGTINTEVEDHNEGKNATTNTVGYYFLKEIFIPNGVIKSITIRAYVDDGHIWFLDGTEIFRTQMMYNPETQASGTPITMADQVQAISSKAAGEEGDEENNIGTDSYGNSDERTASFLLNAFTPGTHQRLAIYGCSNGPNSSDFIFDGQIELTYYLPIVLNAASTTDAATVTVTADSSNLLPITLSAASTTDAATVEIDNIRPIVLGAVSTTDASTATVTRLAPITLSGASTTDASTVEIDNLRQIALSAVSTTDASTVLLTRTFGITHSAVSTTDASTVLITRGIPITLSAVSDTEAALVRLTRGFDITMLGASTTDASTATVTALRGITLSAPSTTDASTAEIDKTIPITLTGASTTDASTVSLTRGLNIALAAASTTDTTTVLLTVGRPITLLGESETDASTVLISRQANLALAADSTTDASTVEVDRVIGITLAANSTTDCSEARVSQVVGITLAANSTTDASTATLTRLFGITFSAISDTDCSTATISTGLNLSLLAASTTDASSILVRRDLAVTLAAASTTDAATIDLDIGKFIVLTANSTTDASSIAVTFGISMAADSTTDASTAEVDAIRPITLNAASTTDASSIGIVRQYQLSAVGTTDASEALVTTLFDISLAAASTTDASTARATAVRPIALAAASTTDASVVGLTVGQTINIMLFANSTTDASTALVTRGLDITLSADSTTDASTVPITERKQVLDDVSAAIVDTIGQVSVGATVLETPVIVDQPGDSVRTGTVLDTLTILDTPIKTDTDIVEIELMPSRTPRGWFQTKQGGEQWTLFEHRTSLTDPLVGRTIFRKAVDFGALPNSELKSVVHGITDIDVNGWVRISGIVRGGNVSEELSGAQNVTSVLVDSGTVKITTDADLSGKTAVVLLEYTKS